MKNQISNLAALLMILFLIGCTAIHVPSTDDPNKKIKDALDLVLKQERPIPAEKLLHEAIEIFQKNGDSKGLAAAYRAYGVFFQSKAVNDMKEAYEGNGFLDKSVNFSDRYTKALEYFDKAESISEKAQDYNLLSNIAYNKAVNYQTTGDSANACQSHKASLEWNRKAHEKNPSMKFYIPGMGHVTFEKYRDFYIKYMKELGCD